MLRTVLGSIAIALLVGLLVQGCTTGPAEDLIPGQRNKIDTQASATPQTTSPGEAVTLTATASADVDGGTITYAWLQTSGPGVSVNNAAQPTASFVAPSLPSDEVLQFTVTTTNERGDVGRATVSVLTLADPNYGQEEGGSRRVVARAGPDREAGAGSVVTLDGSGSRGTGLSYEWTQTAGETVELENASRAVATFVAPDYVVGGDNRLEFELTVRDSRGRSDTDSVVIRVVEASGGSEAYPRVRFTTTMGTFVVELNRQKAPKTVDNFLDYVEDDFYDGTIFHRVIADFMIQGGGYLPGLVEKETRDPIDNESDNGLSNLRGTIAMARRSDPDSATSQFYINVVNNKHLDATGGANGYTVFGEVVEGMDVVDAISEVQTESRDNFNNVPVNDVVIISAVRIAAVKQDQPGDSTTITDGTHTHSGSISGSSKHAP